jgi:murein L,D-transpeptidase YafK
MKFGCTFLFLIVWFQFTATAQSAVEPDFFQTSKEAKIYRKIIDNLRQELESKGFEWPVDNVFIRAFKLEKEMEVWIQSNADDTFRLFKSYPLCALSGTFGPKRKEGDKQIPEGFYRINEWKPYSNFHLALGLNYPNTADLLQCDPQRPGGDIYIHGKCVTIGCLPITDVFIEQLYCITAVAKHQGQDLIPVHIFPYRFNRSTSVKNFQLLYPLHAKLKSFHLTLLPGYTYFEKYHRLPTIETDSKGRYVLASRSE